MHEKDVYSKTSRAYVRFNIIELGASPDPLQGITGIRTIRPEFEWPLPVRFLI